MRKYFPDTLFCGGRPCQPMKSEVDFVAHSLTRWRVEVKAHGENFLEKRKSTLPLINLLL